MSEDNLSELRSELRSLALQCSNLQLQLMQQSASIRKLFILFGALVAITGGVNFADHTDDASTSKTFDVLVALIGGGSAAYGAMSKSAPVPSDEPS